MEPLAELLGESPAIVALRTDIATLLQRARGLSRFLPILIQGETGTGKGLVARAIHRAGPRASGPFVDINCAAIPETLLEAELFGYERGAFTDARQAKAGLFQTAHRGTLFLDEIGLMPLGLQAKLLKAIEERAVRRLGGTRVEEVDVFIIAATSEDLTSAMREGRFRLDLYHRLAGFKVALPPLRQRGHDIILLAELFLGRACGDYGVAPMALDAGAREALLAYPWPGNVRELGNVIERATLVADTQILTGAQLALPRAPVSDDVRPVVPETPSRSERDAVRQRLEQALAETGWNLSRTAAVLGISRNTVKSRIARFRLGEASQGGRPVRPENPDPTPRARGLGVHTVASWTSRRLTFVRMSVTAADLAAESRVARQFDVAADRIGGFGGRVEGMGPRTMLAVFGLEPGEEPTVSAGYSALMIRTAAREVWPGETVPIKIGLHVAELLVSLGDGPPQLDAEASRLEWTRLETTMESAESGSIVATTAASAFLRRRFTLTAGETDAGYRLDGLWRADANAGTPRGRFIGRREELALLESRLGAAVEGRGQVADIVGEAGIGKSRLLLELTALPRSAAARYLEGRCLPSETRTPFFPLLQIVRSVCGIAEAASADVIRESVISRLSALKLEREGLAPALVHLLDPTLDPPPTIDPGLLKQQLFTAILRLLLAQSVESPLIITVEDLHWVDPSSEACLGEFVESITNAPIFLVTTHRPEYRPPWSGSPHALHLTLPAFGAEDSWALIREVFDTGRWSTEVARRIQERAGGNPLFLEELSRAAAESGGGALPERIPATIEATIAARLARLQPQQRRLLGTAAVIGLDVSRALLQAIGDAEEHALQSAMAALQRAGFVEPTGPRIAEPGYVFKHALIHEVAYASVPSDQRRVLHQRVVETIESLYRDHLGEHVERLATHAFRAEIWDKAFRYLRDAGFKAGARSAYPESLAYFEQALVALQRQPNSRDVLEQSIDFRLAIRQAHLTVGVVVQRVLQIGQLDASWRYLQEAETLARGLGDRQRLGGVLSELAYQCWQTGRWRHGLSFAGEVHEIAQQAGDSALEVSARFHLGQLHLGIGAYRQATECFRANVEALVGDRRLKEQISASWFPGPASLSWLAVCLANRGDFDEAFAHGGEGLRLAEELDHGHSLIVGCWCLAACHAFNGDFGAATQLLDRALKFCEDRNLPVLVPRVTGALGYAYTRSGRVTEGLAMLERTLTDIESVGERFFHTQVVASLAEALLLASRRAEASVAADRALTLARERGERGQEARALQILGDIAMASEPPDDHAAEGYYRDALALADELDMRPLAATIYHRLGGDRVRP